MTEPESADEGMAFLLEEYRQLHELRRSIMNSAHNQVSIFFATASALGLALGFFVDDADLTKPLATVVTMVSLFLLATGIGTLWRLAEFHASHVTYSRGLNRIRGYMAEKHPAIVPALSLPTDDLIPQYTRSRPSPFKITLSSGRSSIVILVNTALSGTAAYTTSSTLEVSPRGALANGVVVAGFMWWYQQQLEDSWLEAAGHEHS